MNICTDFPHPAGQAAFAPEDRPAKKIGEKNSQMSSISCEKDRIFFLMAHAARSKAISNASAEDIKPSISRG